MKKQTPPKPNPDQHQYELEERRDLQNSLKRYNCSLSAELSEQVRVFGMSEGRHQNVCQVVNDAVREFIKKKKINS